MTMPAPGWFCVGLCLLAVLVAAATVVWLLFDSTTED